MQSPLPKRRRIDQHTNTLDLGGGGANHSPERQEQFDPDDRIVIALDLDAFYVAASRKRDPSLVGLPIGIKQKGILATISYEARAMGVTKLATIKEALRQCPDMILVNGEDLSYFRQLSHSVWRLVSSIVWGARVEKLGMDELFCDVTEMVDAHLSQIEGNGSEGNSLRYFNLSPPLEEAVVTHPSGSGFQYDPSLFVGHILPVEAQDGSSFDRYQRRLLVAMHLAAYLRQRVSEEVGLTASAGVASNKLLSKLVGARNKPNQQTVFLPPAVPPSGSSTQYGRAAWAQAFLDPLELRQLTGFGGSIVNKIRAALGGETLGHSGTEWLNGGLGADPQAGLQDPRGGAPPVKLTVELTRRALSRTQFDELFGARLGARLWALLHGRGDEPIVPAPEYPAQISIEDTYRGLKGAPVQEQLEVLSCSLLRRLETELVDRDNDEILTANHRSADAGMETEDGIRGTVRSYEAVDENTKAPNTGRDWDAGTGRERTWKRYPLSVRVSVRQGWSNRVSKQGRMPVGIFNLSSPRHSRAQLLARTASQLLRNILSTEGDKGEGFNLLSIAAISLSTKRPTRSIDHFFNANANPDTETERDTLKLAGSAGSGLTRRDDEEANDDPPVSSARPQHRHRHNNGAEEIDPTILDELPPDIRAEVAAQYGIRLPPKPTPTPVPGQDRATAFPADVPASAQDEQFVHRYRSSGSPDLRTRTPPYAHASFSSSSTPSSSSARQRAGIETEESIERVQRVAICDVCGKCTQPWLLHDHEVWPRTGLPVYVSGWGLDADGDTDGNSDLDGVLDERGEEVEEGRAFSPDLELQNELEGRGRGADGDGDLLNQSTQVVEACSQCGMRIPDWMRSVHQRFHEAEAEEEEEEEKEDEAKAGRQGR